jgi:divalent metal cation (Fe/Co/Zn/Cd) transporter
LVSISYKLANEIRKLIVGESISREERNKIKSIINEYSIVEHINRVQTMIIGNDKYLVLISLDIDNESKGHQIEDTIDQIKYDIRLEIPEVETIYIEVQDPNRTVNS